MVDFWPTLYVFVLATFIGLGVIRRVSRLLHTPLMSLTNAISAIAVVGSILVAGGDYPLLIRMLGAIALFASMTNIVSGFLITDRMLKMFKTASAAAGPNDDAWRHSARVPRRDGAVHLLAALDEHTGDRAQRSVRRRRGHGNRHSVSPGPIARSSTMALDRLAIAAGFAWVCHLSRVPLTAVPQRTALSHAFGGFAAGLVGTAEYYLRFSEAPRAR